MLDQPPWFDHSVNTDLALRWGAMAQRTMMMTVHDRTWKIMSRLLSTGIASAA
jgi:hypothetical protein